jgi:hypothetical protein
MSHTFAVRHSFAFVALACLACAPTAMPPPSAAARATAPATPPATLAPLEGFWISEGYGNQYEFMADGELRESHVTRISCLPVWRAKVETRDAASIEYRRVDEPIRISVRGGDSPDRIRLHRGGAASDVIARRLPAKLAVCDRPVADTPLSNLEVFATTWAENYPFFEETKTDWPKVVAAARAKVSARTSPAELFAVLKGMIEPLHDAHSAIEAPNLDGKDVVFAGFQARAGSLDPNEPGLFDRAQALAGKYVTGELRKACEGQLETGMVAPDVAYLRINSFGNYAKDGTFESGLAALDEALDAFFADARDWRALVIDVRINGGGFDPYGLAIAARLTASEYVAYAKQARFDPLDPKSWTAEQRSVVKPSARPSFHGPVVELIGPNAISAAETFSQALLDRRPSVVRVGQSTQGVFSDVMSRGLPNGWFFNLPNERFVTRGRTYDRVGIPPTARVPVYPPSDFESGRDTALEVAIRIARGGG